MAISKRLRFEILRRDNHTCRYCGRKAPDTELRVDHVIPVALGGTDNPDNLVTSCEPCNTGKSSVPADAPLVDQVRDDALRWGKAIQQAAWWRGIERDVIAEVTRAVNTAWVDWTFGEDKQPIPRPLNWVDNIQRFYEAGLDQETMIHFVGVSMRNPRVALDDAWAYFCGCCWRELERIQEAAKRIIEREGD